MCEGGGRGRGGGMKGMEVFEEIGRGGHGTVHLARWEGRWVALKRVERPGDGDAAGYERELRGVRTLARIPPKEGLVRIFAVEARADGRGFEYAMELADDEEGRNPGEGGYRPKTLAGVVAGETALPLKECVEIGIRIAGVLEHLQRHHVLHRDVKPGNIVFVGGKAVLADVGLAADARETASAVGTPGYAPPEREGSPGGDVYGLGMTLWRISTGRTPDEDGLAPCREADLESPHFCRWVAVLRRATSRDPERRYRSAKGMLKDLRKLRRQMRGRGRRLAWGLAAAAAVALLAPAAWNFAPFRVWYGQGADWRFHQKPPFPYGVLKPLLAPKEDPMDPRYFQHATERAVASIEAEAAKMERLAEEVERQARIWEEEAARAEREREEMEAEEEDEEEDGGEDGEEEEEEE